MKTVKGIHFIQLLNMLLLTLLLGFEPHIEVSYLLIVVFFISSSCFLFIRKELMMLLFLFSVFVVTGGFFVYIMMARKELIVNQTAYVVQFMIFTALLLFHWFIVYRYQQQRKMNVQLEKQVSTLQKYVNTSDAILTVQEFKARQKIILNGMARRKEEGYYLLIDNIANQKMKKAINAQLGVVLLETLREEYDLICEYDHKTYIVLMQNTDDIGIQSYLRRFEKKAEDLLHQPSLYIHVRRYPVENAKSVEVMLA